MQIDMHYDCNYFLARMAGLSPMMARHIATSGQFVDDNVCQDSKIDFEDDNHIKLKDGFEIRRVATAHHVADVENFDELDQIQVWIPFHFYPGCLGATQSEQLVCIKDGGLINEAKQHCLSLSDKTYAPFYVGIIAHVYGDTFSHYGFSGRSDPINLVKKGLLASDEEKSRGGVYEKLLEKVVGIGEQYVGSLPSLGHGAALTFPDKPFLKWSLEWENPELRSDDLPRMEQRNNPETFLEGVEALYEFFVAYRDKIENLDPAQTLGGVAKPVDYGIVKTHAESVINEAGDVPHRRKKWLGMAEKIFPLNGVIKGFDEAIPSYEDQDWNKDWEIIKGDEDSLDENALIGKPFWQFYQAAAEHRRYTLEELLPKHGVNLL